MSVVKIYARESHLLEAPCCVGIASNEFRKPKSLSQKPQIDRSSQDELSFAGSRKAEVGATRISRRFGHRGAKLVSKPSVQSRNTMHTTSTSERIRCMSHRLDQRQLLQQNLLPPKHRRNSRSLEARQDGRQGPSSHCDSVASQGSLYIYIYVQNNKVDRHIETYTYTQPEIMYKASYVCFHASSCVCFSATPPTEPATRRQWTARAGGKSKSTCQKYIMGRHRPQLAPSCSSSSEEAAWKRRHLLTSKQPQQGAIDLFQLGQTQGPWKVILCFCAFQSQTDTTSLYLWLIYIHIYIFLSR